MASHQKLLSRKEMGSKIALVRSLLRVPQAAGQVKILIFLAKINLFPHISIVFVMQGKCLFSDISRPVTPLMTPRTMTPMLPLNETMQDT